MYFVLCDVVGVDENVVKVSGAEDIQKMAKYVIDELLEGSWGVCESKEHDKRLKQFPSYAEGSLPNVVVGNSNQVVVASDIQCSIHLGL